jgi:Rrf2 family protein
MLSKSCIYGIRAALYIASLEKDTYVSIGDISKHLNISFHFLTKILQKLTQENIMTSFRGPSGGVAVARPAESIYLIEIMNAIDGLKIFEKCVLGLPGCGDRQPCPLHDEWGPVRDQIKSIFENTSLAELSQKINEFNLRLTE